MRAANTQPPVSRTQNTIAPASQIIASPGFETKKMSVSIAATGGQVPLRIALAVSAESTTVNVQGRADDLGCDTRRRGLRPVDA